MSSMISAGGGIVQIVDLTFKISGIAEQNEEIQKITRAAAQAVQTLTTLYMLIQLIKLGTGPIGWIAFGATALGQGASMATQFTGPEEVISRGK